VSVRVGLGQPPVDRDGFPGGRQRLLVAPRLGETDSEGVQRPGEEVQVGIGVGLGELPVDRDGLLGGSQRLLVSTQIRQGELDCVQRDREDGQVVGVGGDGTDGNCGCELTTSPGKS